MTNKEIIDEAVRRAQIEAGGVFSFGQTVAHPTDKLIYEFMGIGNSSESGVVGLEGGIEKEFPLSELFDPNIAKRIALEISVFELMGTLRYPPKLKTA